MTLIPFQLFISPSLCVQNVRADFGKFNGIGKGSYIIEMSIPALSNSKRDVGSKTLRQRIAVSLAGILDVCELGSYSGIPGTKDVENWGIFRLFAASPLLGTPRGSTERTRAEYLYNTYNLPYLWLFNPVVVTPTPLFPFRHYARIPR